LLGVPVEIDNNSYMQGMFLVDFGGIKYFVHLIMSEIFPEESPRMKTRRLDMKNTGAEFSEKGLFLSQKVWLKAIEEGSLESTIMDIDDELMTRVLNRKNI
jgi:hypothetical protein